MSGQFQNGTYKQIKWLCQCDCGNIVSVRGVHLRKGVTKSCGCLRTLPKGEGAFRKVYNTIVQGARVRNLSFELTMEQVKEICSKPCSYCGIPPSNIKKASTGNFVHNGIDRVDNKRGYEIGNVVPCCNICNQMKHAMPLDKFLNHIKNIYNHIKP